jgi:hypothetical protein
MLDRHTQLLLPLRSPLFPSVQVSECLEKSRVATDQMESAFMSTWMWCHSLSEAPCISVPASICVYLTCS